VATLTQVISTVVNNDGSTNDGVGTKQLHQSVLLGTLGDTLGVGGNVTQVTNVSVVIFWGTVLLAKWVEVRTSRGATVGVVTKSVDVETSQSIGVVTSDLPRDGGWVRLGGLLKVDDTTDGFFSSKDGN